jgi:hypothetical protein
MLVLSSPQALGSNRLSAGPFDTEEDRERFVSDFRAALPALNEELGLFKSDLPCDNRSPIVVEFRYVEYRPKANFGKQAHWPIDDWMKLFKTQWKKHRGMFTQQSQTS